MEKQYPNTLRLPFFPDPTCDLPGSKLPELDYCGILDRSNNIVKYYDNPTRREMRCLFIAKMDGSKDVVVKFPSRYGKEAHELLASKGLAPKLHYCLPVVGGLYMIVMDRVEGRLLDAYKGKRLDESVFAELDAAVSTLSEAGLVHGDLRDVNIIIDPTGKHAKVIDFDWAFEESDGEYPDTANKEELAEQWHPDVDRSAKMKTEHDHYALHNVLKPKYF